MILNFYCFFVFYNTIFKFILLALKDNYDKNHSEDTVLQKHTYILIVSKSIIVLFK